MAQDDIIARLVDETFNSHLENSRIVTNRENDFNIMTQLSKLPIQNIKGHFVSRDLLEFSIAGTLLHVPLSHLESGHLKIFTKIVQSLVNEDMDASLLYKSPNGVWFLGWDSSDNVSEDKLFSIFNGGNSLKAA